jgi:lysozyme family protein
VRLLTPETAAPVYKDGYWLKCQCDKLPAGVDYMVFDLAVNSGTNRAMRYLQRAVGAVEDGKIGPKTLSLVNKLNEADIIRTMSDIREEFYRSLNTFSTFGKGWIRRLNDVERVALDWA